MSVAASREFKQHLISDREFTYLKNLIYKEAGINLTEAKKCLVQTRIGKLMRRQNIDGYSHLFALLESDSKGIYLEQILNSISTNHTFFFREDSHFKYLVDELVPQLLLKLNGEPLKIWSAGCSSGEEPYSLAMSLSETQTIGRTFNFSILATDISTSVLDIAKKGIYPLEEIAVIENRLQKKYFQVGKGQFSDLVKVKPMLREKITFEKHNLLTPLAIPVKFNIIFCRNVMIYFDSNTKEKIVSLLHSKLKNGGFFITGHSESLGNINHSFDTLRPTIYQHKG